MMRHVVMVLWLLWLCIIAPCERITSRNSDSREGMLMMWHIVWSFVTISISYRTEVCVIW